MVAEFVVAGFEVAGLEEAMFVAASRAVASGFVRASLLLELAVFVVVDASTLCIMCDRE